MRGDCNRRRSCDRALPSVCVGPCLETCWFSPRALTCTTDSPWPPPLCRVVCCWAMSASEVVVAGAMGCAPPAAGTRGSLSAPAARRPSLKTVASPLSPTSFSDPRLGRSSPPPTWPRLSSSSSGAYLRAPPADTPSPSAPHGPRSQTRSLSSLNSPRLMSPSSTSTQTATKSRSARACAASVSITHGG
jgi:hypothetical protein